jgi:hypothetical protein
MKYSDNKKKKTLVYLDENNKYYYFDINLSNGIDKLHQLGNLF